MTESGVCFRLCRKKIEALVLVSNTPAASVDKKTERLNHEKREVFVVFKVEIL